MIADVLAGIYAVANRVRQTVRDKASNDELMQRLVISIEGVTHTIDQVVRGNTMTDSSHPSLREVMAELEVIDTAASYYLGDCSEAWRYGHASSFKSEFDALMNRLDNSLGRLTAAVSVDNGAAMKEVLANTQHMKGDMMKQLAADLPRLRARMDTIVTELTKIQKAKEGEEATVAPAVEVCFCHCVHTFAHP